MERSKLTKGEAKKFLQLEGEARGIHFKNDADYVLEKVGKEGLKKVQKELEKVGCPLKYREIKSLGFYPIGWRVLSLLALQTALQWDDKELRELGAFTTGVSLVVKIYMRFFSSIELLMKKAPQIYNEYFTKGTLIVPNYDIEKKYAVVELRDLDLHPSYCRVLEGYLENFVKMVIKTKTIKCQETECTFHGGDCHRFKITWE